MFRSKYLFSRWTQKHGVGEAVRGGGSNAEEVHTDGGTLWHGPSESPESLWESVSSCLGNTRQGRGAGIFILQFPSVVGEGCPGKCRLWHVQPTEATSKYVNCPHGSPGVGRSYLGRAFMASAICEYSFHGVVQTNWHNTCKMLNSVYAMGCTLCKC